MTMLRPPSRVARRLRRGTLLVLSGALLALASAVAAPRPQPQLQPQPQRPSASAPPAAGRAEAGVRWRELSAPQREALGPLEREWPSIDASRKQKWITLAGRFPSLGNDERARITARMSDWARLTPAERGQARLRFEEVRQVPAPDRNARWEVYQALPADRKEQFAARAASAASSTLAAKAGRPVRDAKEAKVNVVPSAAQVAPPKQVAPTLVQAGPGATTTLITRRPAPPIHQQTGMPKIAATPGVREPLDPAAATGTPGNGRGAAGGTCRPAARRPAATSFSSAAHCSGGEPAIAMTLAGAGGAGLTAPGATPSLLRRMACFVYEATLLFGLGLIPGIIGALFVAQTGQRHPLQGETALRVFALLFYGVYFVWFWAARGQTLAMQTWRIRLVTENGGAVSQARALARYAACCTAWFLPATLVAAAGHLGPWPSLAATAAGIVAWALLALAEPTRQFWHDRVCGTRLIDVSSEPRGRRRRA